MDAATEFLIRKDKKALARVLKKGETTYSVIQAKHGGRTGLLAATTTRLLFLARRVVGNYTVQVPRDDIASLKEQPDRYGAIVATTKRGTKLRFEMTHRGAAKVWLDKVAPGPKIKTSGSQQTRTGGPMQFTPTKPKPEAATPAAAKPANAAAARQAHDPLAASKQEKLTRLERLKEKGMITDAEYRWQKDALS